MRWRQLTPDSSTVGHALVGIAVECLERARIGTVVWEDEGQYRDSANVENDIPLPPLATMTM
jgi:hypothetical protein